jgi:hypothetical protein
MSTILEADETGALRLPPSVLPHPAPHRRYRVAAEGGRVVVSEATAEAEGIDTAKRHAWLEGLREMREQNATGKTGISMQQIWDEIREDRC